MLFDSVTTHTQTAQVTQTKGVEFDRTTPLGLPEIAADLAAGKITVRATLEASRDGKQRVDALLVLAKN